MAVFERKVLVCGDPGVGKTSIWLRFANEGFSETVEDRTDENAVKKRTLKVDNQQVTLEVFDTQGFEKFRNVTSSYYRGANGILLVFDVTAPATFNNLRGWHADCQKFTSECAFVLVANKSDDKSEVSDAEAEALCRELKIKDYILTSAKEGTNVDKAFTALAQLMLAKKPQYGAIVGRESTKSSSSGGCVLL